MLKNPRINLHQLVSFYFVAKEQSFTAASERLFLTESAVSQQIKALEAFAGAKLIYVKNKRVHLTETGQILLKYAEEIYNQAKNIDAFLEEITRHRLRVGVAATFSGVVSSAAVQFGNHFPETILNMRSGPSHIIVNQLLDQQYDVAIVPSANYQTNKLKAVRLSDEEKLLTVTSLSAPVCETDSLTLADLCDYTFIIPLPGSETRQILLDRFKAEGLKLMHFVEVETDCMRYETMLTEMEKGIAFLPETEAHNAASKGILKILPLNNEICLAVDALLIKDAPQNDLAEEFINLTKQAFNTSHQGIRKFKELSLSKVDN